VPAALDAQSSDRVYTYIVLSPVMGADGTSVPRMPGHRFRGDPAECEPLVAKGVLKHA
jgi:hypothetical protein